MLGVVLVAGDAGQCHGLIAGGAHAAIHLAPTYHTVRISGAFSVGAGCRELS